MGVLNDTSPCPVPNRHGEPCGKPSQPALPWPCCGEHAIALWKAMDKLVGGTAVAGAR